MDKVVKLVGGGSHILKYVTAVIECTRIGAIIKTLSSAKACSPICDFFNVKYKLEQGDYFS